MKFKRKGAQREAQRDDAENERRGKLLKDVFVGIDSYLGRCQQMRLSSSVGRLNNLI